MFKMMLGACALTAVFAGAAGAQGYDPGPRPPYATGAYIGIGGGNPDCSFTIAGAHAGVTVLGINVGAGARIGLPGGCARDEAPVSYGPPPPPAYADQPQPYPAAQPYGYPQPAYGYQGGGYQGGYPQSVAYPQPAPYGYAPQPCGCQNSAYRPY